jgi:multidrug efflux system membrane fusion protein
LACVVLSLAMFVTACGKKEEEIVTQEVVRPVKTIKVGSMDVSFRQTYPGRVRAAKRADLAFQVDGPLIKLPVDEGQEVKKNDLIARIDPKDFQTNLRNAEGNLGGCLAKRQVVTLSSEIL